jgi:fatty acid desaturase
MTTPADKIQIPHDFFVVPNIKSILHIILCCTALISTGLIAYYVNSPLVYCICFILVGILAEALFILQHDAMHGILVSNRKWNDYIGTILSAMLGSRLYDGRSLHMKHHAKLNTAEDPNLYWYDENKITRGSKSLLFMLKQLSGAKLYAFATRTLLTLSNALSSPKTTPEQNSQKSAPKSNHKDKSDLFSLITVQMILLAIFSYFSSPLIYFFVYFLPIITITSFLESIRTFSEHVNDSANEVSLGKYNTSRLYFVDCSLIERLILAPYGFHYHHLHHFYPMIPVFKLKALHKWMILNDINYQNKYRIRQSYFLLFFQYAFSRGTNEICEN